MNYTQKELKEIISDTYGFKQELIQVPQLRGLWHVSFEVNGIKYYGWTAHSGAVPQIESVGVKTPYHDHMGTPVNEEYYNEFIKGKRAVLIHITDTESGDWEKTDVEFENQEEAESYIQNLEDSNLYTYDFLD